MNEKLYKSYIVHDDKQVKGFFDDYRWMSNFHITPVWYEGVLYPSSENAYQAAKVDCDDRKEFLTCTPNESKKLWKSFHSIYTEESWDIAKFDIMSSVVFDKFVMTVWASYESGYESGYRDGLETIESDDNHNPWNEQQ